ncbi:unnamed protein product [Amoebophrya sp. A120]|nr:unnamed protein product [Amoebophrya sp. A120]|eukprot:GSA120T00020992001.1
MEVFFYVLANGFFLLAGLLLLRDSTRKNEYGKPVQVMVARDTQIMFFLGTLLRFYWSASPPAVWSNEGPIVRTLCQADICISPIVWGCVLAFVAMQQTKYCESLSLPLPLFKDSTNVAALSASGMAKNRIRLPLNWFTLTVATLLLSIFLHHMNPPSTWHIDEEDDQPWPMADVSVVWNMLLDCVAMFPQLYIIYVTPEPPSDGAANFVGILCVARVLRMVAWGHIIFTAWVRSIGVPGFLWCYVLPDFCHSLLMGKYLWLFLARIKKNHLDRWMHNVDGEMV